MALPAPIPTGAVTFAFTDIEGSTVRWERDRAAMQEAVRRHDAILRAAITEHGGHVFKTIGDAFCAAFTRPDDAVAAMLAVQQVLAAEDFSAVEGLRVRMALHIGDADERDGDYFGPAVNRVARLMAAAAGGQVLLSRATAELVRARGITLRDLGEHRLKGLNEAEQIFQLLADGLPSDFAPLRSMDAEEIRSVPGFTGRDEELATLSTALERDDAIAAVHGLGGTGKSSLAREYAWRNRNRYAVTWWLNAQTESGIIDGLLRLGALFVEGLDQLTDRRAAAQQVIRSALSGFTKPLLLVFDNLEDEQLLPTWRPKTGSRVIVTSRNAAWEADITAIALHTWELETAIAYLQHASGRTDLTEADARAIAQALGALPLAMSHAAASLRGMRMVTPGRYLERIGQYLKNAPRGAEYPRSVFATFSTAITQAEQQAPGAASVLCFAASFAPDAIPDELFRQPIDSYAALQPTIVEPNALDLRSALAEDLRVDDALGALDRLSLLVFSEASRTYSLHRLVQFAARDMLAAEDAQAWRECAVAVGDVAFPEVEFATWPQCERLLPHAVAALDALPSAPDLLSAASLARRCGWYLRERGEYHTAEPLCARALAIREKALGPDDADVAQSVNDVAALCWVQGRHAEAELLFTRALAIREKVFGPDHPGVMHSLSNLAVAYADQGKYAAADSLFSRALAIREKTLGPDHPDVATSLNNLAGNHANQGQYAAAEPLFARALAIREKALAADHPEVAATLDNLARVYRKQERYAEAEPLHTRALAIREKVLGTDHPDVAYSLHNLAELCADQERYVEAEPLLMRALAIREKTLGPEHPNFALTLAHLATVYQREGRYEEAESLYTRTLAIWAKALGPDHPEVATTLNDLANLHEEQGRAEEAESFYVRSLAIREKALGTDNALTKAVREKLSALRS